MFKSDYNKTCLSGITLWFNIPGHLVIRTRWYVMYPHAYLENIKKYILLDLLFISWYMRTLSLVIFIDVVEIVVWPTCALNLFESADI